MAWLSPPAWAACLMLLLCAPSHATDFASRTADGLTMVRGAGPLQTGDWERFQQEVAQAPRGSTVALRIDSRGGPVLAGESLASVVKRHGVPVLVGDGDVCVSACFLVFAASPAKFAAATARIGVHGAADGAASLPIAAALARSASSLGVPAAIVGRIVAVAPGEAAWLSRGELASLGTTFLDPPAPPIAPAPPPPVASLAPPKPGAVAKDEGAPSFVEGRASRTAWEQWFATLGGDMRSGAEFWSTERNKRRPAECAGTTEFLAGCTAARQRLTGPDIRRKTDAQYWWGWNSL